MLSPKDRRIIDLSLPLRDGGGFAAPASIRIPIIRRGGNGFPKRITSTSKTWEEEGMPLRK